MVHTEGRGGVLRGAEGYHGEQGHVFGRRSVEPDADVVVADPIAQGVRLDDGRVEYQSQDPAEGAANAKDGERCTLDSAHLCETVQFSSRGRCRRSVSPAQCQADDHGLVRSS